MDAIEVILSLLGVGAAGVYLIWAIFAAFNILWAIFSAILAKRRGRNAWNWFFLTCFYGIFGLLFLACSKTINQGEYRESDTLAKVLWWVFLIPTTIIVTLSIIISIEKRKDDELTRKVLEDMKQEEQMYHRDRNDNIPTFDDWDRQKSTIYVSRNGGVLRPKALPFSCQFQITINIYKQYYGIRTVTIIIVVSAFPPKFHPKVYYHGN